MMSVSERVAAIAVQMLAKRGSLGIPAPDTNLRDAGLTSLDMVNLILAVEGEFDIEIPQTAMTPENFNTLAAIVTLVSNVSISA